MSYTQQLAGRGKSGKGTNWITTGVVVDVDDPQQNGRIRAACQALGDETDPKSINLQNIPWATMAPPLGGSMTQGFREVMGQVDGETPYGFFGVPKVGTEVVIAVIDGDNGYRVCLGCLQHNGATGAAPHGRYQSSGSYPDGPLAMNGKQIQPLYNNLTAMFSGPYGQGRSSYEWMSRGSDYTFSAHRGSAKNARQSDDDNENVTISEGDGRTINFTQGYAKDRMGDQPGVVNDPDRKYDPQTYAWVTPGFHSVSMDDRSENCRVRIRSTSAHQIILDDTNERIYIASNKGKNWIEMDSCGNIDIHSDTRVSIHAAKDINMTSEGTIRLASKDLHLRASNELRMYSDADMHMFSNKNIRSKSTLKTVVETGTMFEVLATADARITSNANVHVLANANLHLNGNSAVHVLSSGNVIQTGAKILANSSPAATAATPAAPSESKTAYHTNRIPMHEPWPRVLTDKEKSDKDDLVMAMPVVYTSGSLADFEYKSYDDESIGRVEYGVSLGRNVKWHR